MSTFTRRPARPSLFEQNIAAEKVRLQEEAARLPPNHPDMPELLQKIRQLETASRINEWLASPGLAPPKQ